jgi:hypothetical protein
VLTPLLWDPRRSVKTLELDAEDNLLTLQEVRRSWTENRITYGLVICNTQYSHNITWIRA